MTVALIYLLAFISVSVLFYALMLAGFSEVSGVYSRYHHKRRGVFFLLAPAVDALAAFNRRHLDSDNRYLTALRRKMKYAGAFRRFSPEQVIALQQILALAAMIAGIVMILFSDMTLEEDLVGMGVFLAVIVLMTALAPMVPLDNAIARRQKEILDSWPFFLDLLTIAIEAGMELTLAIERIVRTMPLNALTEELMQVRNEISLGSRRREALGAMSERINIPFVNSVVMMLVQAEELGTPLGPLLRTQASEYRTLKAQEIEKRALEAPVKMLLPLLGCIFPAILIIMLGPVMIQYFQAQ